MVTLEPPADDDNVKAITRGMSPDVVEMDAASHRKIDDIRDVIAQLKFAPISSKYKIYIIDEVHMLTKEAFNALLKSLEEPPASTIFILATTEGDMLPRTITSRCIRVNFNEATDKDIISMLQRIVKNEKIKIDKDVLENIAQNSSGSFRDAAKILELMALDKDFSLESAKRVIGHTVDPHELLKLIDAGGLQAAMAWWERHRENGSGFKILITSILN